MAFYMYETDGKELVKQWPVSLFGNRNGLICNILQQTYAKEIAENREPLKWKMTWQQISAFLNKNAPGNYKRVVIDLKPNDTHYTSLYLIEAIYGFSGWTWTPIMIRLKDIYTDKKKGEVSVERVPFNENAEIIYSLLYMQGDFHDGKVRGTWNAPRPSSTNTPLLWPETFEYFIDCRNETN